MDCEDLQDQWARHKVLNITDLQVFPRWRSSRFPSWTSWVRIPSPALESIPWLMPVTLLFSLVPVVVLQAGAGGESEARRVSALIRQLGHEKFAVREAASKELETIGEAAWQPLVKAARGAPDLETRRRAERLAHRIAKRLFVEVRHFGGPVAGYWLNRVAFTRDGRRAIATGGAVIAYDLESGREIYRVLELQYARPGLALSRDGRYFLTSHQHDPIMRLGDITSGKEVRQFVGHTAGVQGVALSPDGSLAVSGSDDGTMRLWDVKTGKELHVFKGAPGQVYRVAFAPEGKHILSAHGGQGSNNLIRLWDAEQQTERRRFEGHRGNVTALVFHPDGGSFLSSSQDGSVRMWDNKSGRELHRLEHRGGVNDVAVSPDGRRALSAGFGDRMVRLWDLTDGGELHRFEGHQGAVLGVAFSPEGRQALSCDSQYTIRLWRLPGPETRRAGTPP
jgi:WD40 repeat protein